MFKKYGEPYMKKPEEAVYRLPGGELFTTHFGSESEYDGGRTRQENRHEVDRLRRMLNFEIPAKGC